jgi:1-deoxy-D-xylulose-5-phosphate synthase
MAAKVHPLLEGINAPDELRELDEHQLPALADELRAFILNSVAATGGHLSSNSWKRGIEVSRSTIVTTRPDDRLIWDVGQPKLSAQDPDRSPRGDARSPRKLNALIRAFPSAAKVLNDAFGTAHSSTSISAALGMALAARESGQHQGDDRRRHIAVIGDGALSGGMAFEAMNHGGGTRDLDVLVILNDNEMSISPPVGALSHYLTRLLLGAFMGRPKP